MGSMMMGRRVLMAVTLLLSMLVGECSGEEFTAYDDGEYLVEALPDIGTTDYTLKACYCDSRSSKCHNKSTKAPAVSRSQPFVGICVKVRPKKSIRDSLSAKDRLYVLGIDALTIRGGRNWNAVAKGSTVNGEETTVSGLESRRAVIVAHLRDDVFLDAPSSIDVQGTVVVGVPFSAANHAGTRHNRRRRRRRLADEDEDEEVIPIAKGSFYVDDIQLASSSEEENVAMDTPQTTTTTTTTTGTPPNTQPHHRAHSHHSSSEEAGEELDQRDRIVVTVVGATSFFVFGVFGIFIVMTSMSQTKDKPEINCCSSTHVLEEAHSAWGASAGMGGIRVEQPTTPPTNRAFGSKERGEDDHDEEEEVVARGEQLHVNHQNDLVAMHPSKQIC